MSLSALISAGESIHKIADYLDQLPADARLNETMALGSAAQSKLWTLAAEAAPLTLDHFVPASTADRTEVIHQGRNTLPVFTRFQKRFARPIDGSQRLFGYNEGATRPLIGPGCFVTVPTAGNAAWTERGAIVVDYFQVPDGPVPDAWPKVVSNSTGLQYLVYRHTRDFMRRVSSHVSIGHAWKGESEMTIAYFVLCREP
jgi:hypothetical protein